MARALVIPLAVAAWISGFISVPVFAAESATATEQSMLAPPVSHAPGLTGKLMVTVGMSITIDSPLKIERIFIANGDLAEAVAVNPKEVLVSGKIAGQTTLMVWQQGGNRLVYDLTVRLSSLKLEAVRRQIARDFPDDDINVTYDNDTAFVRGSVRDVISADRVMQIASTLGKTINLMRVAIPSAEPEILLRVRFADVDRSVSQSLGVNIASAALGQDTGITTGQFGSGVGVDNTGSFTLSDALNILLFRKDLNLGATIQALEGKNLLEILAQPNLLTSDGQEASFLSGGEFPVPMVQGSSSIGTVTITFREYGIRLGFLPHITPRGTIRMKVDPEVSSLDYSNAVSIGGFTVPALSTRRISTTVELESGESFVIAGLINNSFTENLDKIPGLANIPLLGKLFQSRSQNKSNTELMVIVTPEIVRPIKAGQPLPDLNRPKPFLPTNTKKSIEQPGLEQTGPPSPPPAESLPYEELIRQLKQGQIAPNGNTPQNPGVAQPQGQPVSPLANNATEGSPVANTAATGGSAK